MSGASSRHQQTQLNLTDMLQQIQGVSNEEVASQILSLQTSLSASLSTTARLSQISLLNYLSPA
jgi:flagellin-like hook-associated protein FlgL